MGGSLSTASSGNESEPPTQPSQQAGGRPSASANRYFCHACNRSITIADESNLVCPTCGQDFVEQLDSSSTDPPVAQNLTRIRISPNQTITVETADGHQENIGFDQILSQLPAFFGGTAPAQPRPSTGATTGQEDASPPGSESQPQGAQQAQNHGPIGDILQSLFAGLTQNGAFNVTIGGQGQNLEELNNLLAGGLPNLGDYVAGNGGLDAIITQLLNQAEGGVAPLPRESMVNLTKVEITEDDVEKKLQCPVCFDDFELKQEVTRLFCEHRFHTDCIEPWLGRHNSCPVCRKTADGTEPREAPPEAPDATPTFAPPNPSTFNFAGMTPGTSTTIPFPGGSFSFSVAGPGGPGTTSRFSFASGRGGGPVRSRGRFYPRSGPGPGPNRADDNGSQSRRPDQQQNDPQMDQMEDYD